MLGENDEAIEDYAKADAIAALVPAQLVDWAEAQVRLIKPGAAPPSEAVAVLERLEQAEPHNALALFFPGAAPFVQGDKAVEGVVGAIAGGCADTRLLAGQIREAEESTGLGRRGGRRAPAGAR